MSLALPPATGSASTAAALSDWRYKTFFRYFADAPTWPRENKSIVFAPGPSEMGAKRCRFDGYSYLQSVVSHFCTHRKRQVHLSLTQEQFSALRAISWMDSYLAHLKAYHEKYGNRDRHPDTDQKIAILKLCKSKPVKDEHFHVTDSALLPSGVAAYDFDGRKFIDAISKNWVVAYGGYVKKIGIHLSDRQMQECMAIPWFYDFVYAQVRKQGLLKTGDVLTIPAPFRSRTQSPRPFPSSAPSVTTTPEKENRAAARASKSPTPQPVGLPTILDHSDSDTDRELSPLPLAEHRSNSQLCDSDDEPSFKRPRSAP